MTQEEAIDILRSYLMFDKKSNTKINIALNMAIEKLMTDIVRCGECEHYQDVLGSHGVAPCGYHNKIVISVEFCSWGKRIET